VFERFTDKARRIVVVSQEEARLLDHDYIGTEHLLLGLLLVDDLGGHLLAGRGLTHEEARARVEAGSQPRHREPHGHIPFTPRAKKALEMALREAVALGDHFIGSEHLLLGLLKEGQGMAAEILVAHGIELDEIRRTVASTDRETRRAEGGGHDGSEVASGSAEEVAHLVAEVARLRDLLRRHGIDPDE
jgi:ATP-dependent Clp protease ATP-binding subunit ClpC